MPKKIKAKTKPARLTVIEAMEQLYAQAMECRRRIEVYKANKHAVSPAEKTAGRELAAYYSEGLENLNKQLEEVLEKYQGGK